MNEPYCWTPRQIGELTVVQLRALRGAEPPEGPSSRAERFDSFEEMSARRKVRAEARERAQQADPWGLGE
jgi:hypothetical protein